MVTPGLGSSRAVGQSAPPADDSQAPTEVGGGFELRPIRRGRRQGVDGRPEVREDARTRSRRRAFCMYPETSPAVIR
jgi:hypothetical protein